MYLVNAPHCHKADAQRLLEKLITDRQRLVTDAEALQEILHRYIAIDRRDAIQPAFDALLGVVDQVLAVDEAVVLHEARILGRHQAVRQVRRHVGERDEVEMGARMDMLRLCLPATRCIYPSWNKMVSTTF